MVEERVVVVGVGWEVGRWFEQKERKGGRIYGKGSQWIRLDISYCSDTVYRRNLILVPLYVNFQNLHCTKYEMVKTHTM